MFCLTSVTMSCGLLCMLLYSCMVRHILVSSYREVYFYSQGTFGQSYQVAEPLWTDPGMKSGITVCELILTSTKDKPKKCRWGMNGQTFLPTSSQARKKPPPPLLQCYTGQGLAVQLAVTVTCVQLTSVTVTCVQLTSVTVTCVLFDLGHYELWFALPVAIQL